MSKNPTPLNPKRSRETSREEPRGVDELEADGAEYAGRFPGVLDKDLGVSQNRGP